MTNRSLVFLPVFVFAAFLSARAHGTSDVIEVITANFADVVDGSRHVFLEVYAPWCGHCKQLAPTWDQLGAAFNGEIDVIIGKLDATVEEGIADKLGVKGFPTLLFFEKGSTTPEPYEKARDFESLKTFVNEKIEIKQNFDISEAIGKVVCDSSSAVSDCVELVLAATKEAVTLHPSESDPLHVKCTTFYKTAMEKFAAKSEYIMAETERLLGLAANPGIAKNLKEYVTCRLNILKDLAGLLKQKVPAVLKSSGSPKSEL